MFEQVLKSIQQLGSFSAEESATFATKLRVKKISRDLFLLKEGQICQSFYFINHGSARQYFVTDDGDELTLNLFIENDWVLDYQSFISQKPAKNYIQAFEETEVLELEVQSLHELIAQSQTFFKIAKLMEFGLHDTVHHGNLISPEEKYQEILAKKPLLIQRFPLKYIASYLKMTPETLSRVRRKINH